MTKLEKVSAVHEDDLRTYLHQLGVLLDVELGTMNCSVCGNPLTIDNIAALYPISGTVKAVCDLSACLKRLMRMRTKGG